jgi:peptide/nickel transport system substrate-binding protein
MGDYVADLMEDLGFATERLYRTGAESSPIWMNSDPALGLFHVYTGGWVTTAIARDQGSNFAYYYTKIGRSDPLWQAYENDPAFLAVAEKLWNNDFNSMAERRELIRAGDVGRDEGVEPHLDGRPDRVLAVREEVPGSG